MPWSNQTGGGWNNGGNGGDGPTGGPWGQGPRGPQRPNGGGGGQQPPDLEEIIKRGQDRLKGVIPGGGSAGSGGLGAAGWVLVAAVLGGLWLYASAYQVDADELGVETVFGDPKFGCT